MTTQFQVGDVVECVDSWGAEGALESGRRYTIASVSDEGVACAEEIDPYPGWRPDRFRLVSRVPASAESECICSPLYNKGVNPSCPDHGLRCANVDCNRLCDKITSWSVVVDVSGLTKTFCGPACVPEGSRPSLECGCVEGTAHGCEPRRCSRCTVVEDGNHVVLDPSGLCGHCVCDLSNAKRAAKPVDKYAAHRRSLSVRLDSEDPEAEVAQRTDGLQQGARATLLRNLAAEKPREGAKPFPRVGRNPRDDRRRP